MSDEFDPERWRVNERRAHARTQALTDMDMACVRLLYEALPPDRRAALLRCCIDLGLIQRRLGWASQWFLSAPNFSLDGPPYGNEDVVEDESLAGAFAAVHQQTLSGAGRSIYLCPDRLAVAICCWDAGEEYAPNGEESRDPRKHPRCPPELLRPTHE